MTSAVAVILGGGVGLHESEYRLVLETALRRHVWLDETRDPPLLAGELGEWGGVVGAAGAAFDHALVEAE